MKYKYQINSILNDCWKYGYQHITIWNWRIHSTRHSKQSNIHNKGKITNKYGNLLLSYFPERGKSNKCMQNDCIRLDLKTNEWRFRHLREKGNLLKSPIIQCIHGKSFFCCLQFSALTSSSSSSQSFCVYSNRRGLVFRFFVGRKTIWI